MNYSTNLQSLTYYFGFCTIFHFTVEGERRYAKSISLLSSLNKVDIFQKIYHVLIRIAISFGQTSIVGIYITILSILR